MTYDDVICLVGCLYTKAQGPMDIGEAVGGLRDSTNSLPFLANGLSMHAKSEVTIMIHMQDSAIESFPS